MNKDNTAELEHIVSELAKDKAKKTVLENGLTIITKEAYTAELMTAQVWVKTGSIHEGNYLGCGLSHYVEHMLFKGTENRSYNQISDDIQAVGGNINAYTTFDRTVYYIDGPSEALGTALDILSDICFRSLFDEEETERERDVILREIDMGLDDPDRQLSKAFFKAAFIDHPYKFPVIGEKDLFKTNTRERLYSYYKERYVPSNMTLVVAGPYTHASMVEQIREFFENIPATPVKQVVVEKERRQLTAREQEVYEDVEITRGMMAYKVPGLGHADNPKLAILANLIGQGKSAYLFQKLREEEGLAHSISASMWNPGEDGMFFISYSCDPENETALKAGINEVLETLRKSGFPKEKVAKCIRQALVSEVNSRMTVNGQAAKCGVAEVVIGELDYPAHYLKLLKEVQAEDLKEVLNTYLVEDQSTAVSLVKETKAGAGEGKDTPKIADFEEVVFKNGARLIFQEDKSLPKVSIQALMQGGPLYENANNWGITGVLASMLTKDTHHRSALEIAEVIEGIGGGFSEYAGNNSFGLKMELMDFDLELGTEILSQALLEPKFTEEHFKRERDVQVASIREGNDDVATYAMREMRRHFFGDHPYAHESIGEIDTLEDITLQDIEDFYKKTVAAENLVVSISGSFEKDAMVKLFESWMEKIPSGDFQKAPSPETNISKQEKEEHLDKEQVVTLKAYPSIGVHDERLETTEVLDEILSGMSSNLFMEVREKLGLAYYVGSSRMIGMETGMFFLYAGTNTESYAKVLELMEAELERLRSGDIKDEEVDRAKIRLKTQHRSLLQTRYGRAMEAGLNALYNLPINHFRDYCPRIDAVTKEGIQDFAQNYLKAEQSLQFAVGAIEQKAEA